MKRVFIFLLAGYAFVLGACKKDKPVSPDNNNKTTTTSIELVKDSVFLYAKEDYYWYDGLPDYNTFNPRSFTGSTDLAAVQNEVNAISQYKINPATNKPYEYYSPNPGEAKYSFIDEGEESAKLNTVTGDFGFSVLYNATNDLRVKYVYAGSPADQAGIKRGYRITAINNRTALSYDGGTNVNFVSNAVFNSSTITMTLQKPDGTSMNASLNAATYTINPVIISKVIDAGNGKKVGYIVFNSFVVYEKAEPQLDAAFDAFKTAGITDLIVDLRYNGGGYVETAELLDNLIAPSSVNGKKMYTAYYNTILQSGQEKLLGNQWRTENGHTYNYGQIDFSTKANTAYFGSTHPLNLSRVFFIVSGSTASASELTINNLRPYMDVQLVGRTTYGKPVGFFDIKISKYEMYIPEFETKNANDAGGYYSGMAPGTTTYPGFDNYDDPTKEFGDTSEALLANTLNFIKTGVYKTTSTTIQSLNASNALTSDQHTSMTFSLDGDKFKGMVFQNLKRN